MYRSCPPRCRRRLGLRRSSDTGPSPCWSFPGHLRLARGLAAAGRHAPRLRAALRFRHPITVLAGPRSCQRRPAAGDRRPGPPDRPPSPSLTIFALPVPFTPQHCTPPMKLPTVTSSVSEVLDLPIDLFGIMLFEEAFPEFPPTALPSVDPSLVAALR